MKYCNVKFTFDIPVMIKDDEEDVDAYYAAREKFADYNVNEASVKIEPIDEAKYNHDQELINKLHKSNDWS